MATHTHTHTHTWRRLRLGPCFSLLPGLVPLRNVPVSTPGLKPQAPVPWKTSNKVPAGCDALLSLRFIPGVQSLSITLFNCTNIWWTFLIIFILLWHYGCLLTTWWTVDSMVPKLCFLMDKNRYCFVVCCCPWIDTLFSFHTLHYGLTD